MLNVELLPLDFEACIGLSIQVHEPTHTHPFNGPLSGTTHVSQYHKAKTNLAVALASAGQYASLHLTPDR